ncbi:Trypsin [Popillia japonica]|uniref:Trypsin n=1 Tax=Popillia japonica TaxID=7064 RepID=A0AAW1LA10_POPJA
MSSKTSILVLVIELLGSVVANSDIRIFGSILNAKWILTAAHCLKKGPSDYLIKVGTSDLSSGGTYHRFWRNISPLIELEDEIEFSDLTQPIELETEVVGEVDAVVSGWGLDENDARPDNLKYLNTSILSDQQCSLSWGKRYWSSVEMFTLLGSDSGGPLVANGKQIGVVSWGTAKCGSTQPAVYARVSAYIDWIYNVINS